MDLDTFSNFLLGDGPLPEDEETINFDEFPSFGSEHVPIGLEDHPSGNLFFQEPQALRDQDTTQFYRSLDDKSDYESDEGNETDDEIAEAEEIDAEFPDGEAYDYLDLPPGSKTANNQCTSAELQGLIEETENVLEQLSMQAQVHVERQPLSTQILLADLANEQIFRPYRQHGSQAQFSASVMKFLSGGDTIRRPGKAGLDKAKDGKLKLAPVDPFAEDASTEKRGKLKRKISNNTSQGSCAPGRERIKLKVVKRGDKLVSVMKGPTQESRVIQSGCDTRQSLQNVDKANEQQEISGSDHDPFTNRKSSGPIKWGDLQAAQSAIDPDQDPAEALSNFHGASSLVHNPPRTNILFQPTMFTPLAATFSEVQLQTPLSKFFPTRSFARPMPPLSKPLPAYSCSIDPKANSELALQPYNPISLDLMWPSDCGPSAEYMKRINHILHLYNAEARVMLSYFVRKYDTPFELGGGGPGGGGAVRMGGPAKNEPPHALFRLGIAQYLMCKAEHLLDVKDTDELGLTPEARSILKSVWNEHPSMWTYFEDDFLEDEVSDSEYEDMMTEEDDDGDVIGHTARSAKKPFVLRSPNPKHVRAGLNFIETKLLARACCVSMKTIDAYWDLMRDKTKAWAAVQLWCRARSIERVARAKAEGRW